MFREKPDVSLVRDFKYEGYAVSIRLRPVVQDNYEAVCQIFAEGDAFHSRGRPDLFRPATPSRSCEFFESYLNTDERQLWVAENENEIIGLVEWHVVIRPEQPTMFARRFAMVDSLLVTESMQRQGIGTALMKAVHNWAREREIIEIELNVHEFNQGAITFYESLGYSTASRRMLLDVGSVS